MKRKINDSLVCEVEEELYVMIEESDSGCSILLYNGFDQIASEDVDSCDVYDALDVAVDMICSRFPQVDRASLNIREMDPEWFLSKVN